MSSPRRGFTLGDPLTHRSRSLVVPLLALRPGQRLVIFRHCFDGDQVEAEVADSVQQSVELSLVERFGDEMGVTVPGFNRDARKGGVESSAQSPLDCDAVPPRLHRAPPSVSLLYSHHAAQQGERSSS